MKTRTLQILLLCALSLVVPTLWFGNHTFIVGIDYAPDLHPYQNLYKYLSSWNDDHLGSSDPRYVLLPLQSFEALFDFLGLQLAFVQRLLFYLLFLCSGLSMFFLSENLLPQRDRFRIIASLLYMFNPWALVLVWSNSIASIGYCFAYATLPLGLAVLVGALRQKDATTYLIKVVPLLSLLSTASYASTAILLQWGLIMIFILFYVIPFTQNASRALKLSCLYFGMWLLLNAFWILPVLPIAGLYVTVSPITAAYTLGAFENSAPLFDALRLKGYWPLSYKVLGYPFIPWSPLDSNPLFILLTVLIPILCFYHVARVKNERIAYFFVVLTLIGVFLMKGVSPPGGEFTALFLTQTGLIKLFRNTYAKFGFFATVGYSLAAAYGIDRLPDLKKTVSTHLGSLRINIPKKAITLVLLFLLVGVIPWPMWTGDVTGSSNPVMASGQVKIPDHYYAAAAWINRMPGQFYILTLPLYGSPQKGNQLYLWWNNGSDGYFGPNFEESLFTKPLIDHGLAGYQMAGQIASLISANSTDHLGSLLSLLDVKFVQLMTDTDVTFTKTYANLPSNGDLQSILDHAPDLRFEAQFGQLRFYQNLAWKESTRISIGTQLLEFRGNSTSLQQLILGAPELLVQPGLISVSSDGLNTEPLLNVSVISSQRLSARVDDGNSNRFTWSEAPTGPILYARYYAGWKRVITTDGSREIDTLNCDLARDCPYLFPSFSPKAFDALNSTLLFFKTGSVPLVIERVLLDGVEATGTGMRDWRSAGRMVGVWWRSGWEGMDTKPIRYPIAIPPNQEAIIEVTGHPEEVALDVYAVPRLQSPQSFTRVFNYTQVNPTEYTVRIQNDVPVAIKLNQGFYGGWELFIDGVQVPEDLHFVADGYANGWFISELGWHNLLIKYAPQDLLQDGLIISALSYITCLIVSIASFGFRLNLAGRRALRIHLRHCVKNSQS
jgi:hypothetical protein